MSYAVAHAHPRQFSSVIAGRFEVLRCLGVGSVGAVYLCRDKDAAMRGEDPFVAVKVLTLGTLKGMRRQAVVNRFVEEATLLESINHPNVVRFRELVMEGDECAMAMEFVRGGTLKAIMLRQATKWREGQEGDHERSSPLLPLGIIVRLLADVCRGLAAVHRAGYVHRDIKPENVLVAVDGSVKISDLSSALPIGDSRPLSYEVSGTIEFMSPEFLQSGVWTREGDVYGVGMMAYQLLTGTLPFQAAGIYGSVQTKLASEPVPVGLINPECSMKLSDLVSWSLRRDPSERCPSPEAMLEVLDSLLYAYPLARGTAALSELGVLDDAFIDDDLVKLHTQELHGVLAISTRELIANPNLARSLDFEERKKLVLEAKHRVEVSPQSPPRNRVDFTLKILILLLALVCGAALYVVSVLFFVPYVPQEFPAVLLTEELPR